MDGGTKKPLSFLKEALKTFMSVAPLIFQKDNPSVGISTVPNSGIPRRKIRPILQWQYGRLLGFKGPNPSASS